MGIFDDWKTKRKINEGFDPNGRNRLPGRQPGQSQPPSGYPQQPQQSRQPVGQSPVGIPNTKEFAQRVEQGHDQELFLKAYDSFMRGWKLLSELEQLAIEGDFQAKDPRVTRLANFARNYLSDTGRYFAQRKQDMDSGRFSDRLPPQSMTPPSLN